MATTNSDTAASQGASASGAIAGASSTAANASAGASAQHLGTSATSGGGSAQLIVRPPLDVYKKLAIVRLPDDEVMYQNADGSWGKVANLDETRITNKKQEKEEEDGNDAKMSEEADDNKSVELEDADEEKKDEEVSLVDT